MKKGPNHASRWPLALCACLCLALLAAPAQAAKEPKKRVAVTGFENEAGHTSSQLGDIGGGLTEKLSAALMETDKFVVLERKAIEDVFKEHGLKNVAKLNPDQVARLTSAQALIRGVITNVDILGGGGATGGFHGIAIGRNRQQVKIKVNIRIIDTITGQDIESKTVEGIATQRGLGLAGSFRGFYGANQEQKATASVSDAIDDAVQKAVAQIVAGMERIPWQGTIARVSGSQIFINAGQQENVGEGLRLRVFERGASLIDAETNVDLGSLDEEIGVIQVQRVEPKFSIATIVEGRGFAKGNIVRPVVEEAAKDAP